MLALFPEDDRPAAVRLMTADEVLAVLKTRCHTPGAGRPTMEWTHETAVADALLPSRFLLLFGGTDAAIADVAEGLDDVFGTEIDEDEFEAALRPARSTTIGRLCTFIAAHAVVPMVDPPTPRQAFHVLARILSDAGADVSTLQSSDPLEPYLRRHRKTFENEVVRLGCGKVPVPTVEYPQWISRIGRVGTPVFFAAGVAVLLTGLLGSVRPDLNHVVVPVFMGCWTVGVVTFIGMLLPLWLSGWLGSSRPRLGSLSTFGDLAEAIVGGPGKAEP